MQYGEYKYEVWQNSNETDFLFTKVFIFSNINVIPFKIVFLGSYTQMEKFRLLVAALEVFNRYDLQHVRYTRDQAFFIKTSLKGSEKGPDIADKWILYHDYASCHTALYVTKIVTTKGITLVPQHPFHFTSASVTFSFFLNLKMFSKDVISGL